jgi:flagellar motor switch protein FliM
MGEPEVLNQRTIDGLFASRGRLRPEVGSEQDSQPFSFLRPSRLGRRTQLRFEAAHGAFAQELRKSLSLQLRTSADVMVTSVETVLFSEFTHSLRSPAASFLFPVGLPGGSHGLLDWDTSLALGLVDRLLGGVGDPGPDVRPLTPIERNIMRRVANVALAALRDSWDSMIQVGAEVTGFETNPANLEIARAEDRYLVGLLQVRIGDLEGALTVGVPLAEAPSFADDAPAAQADDAPLSVDAGAHALQGTSLQHSRLTVSARLPELTLRMRTLNELRVGQVLDTGYALNTPVQIHTNGRLIFTGTVGEFHGHVGVQIAGRATMPVAERPVAAKQGRILS